MLDRTLTNLDIERLIHEEILHLLKQHGEHIGAMSGAISNDDQLDANLGLTSSDLVQLVGLLQRKLQADPFERLVSLADMRTVGDLCQAYQQLRFGNPHASDDTDVLLVSRKRAHIRRTRRKGSI